MTNNQETKFENLKIIPELLSILKKNNFVNPTPIQHQVIPVALEGNDVVGIAQTGTGKTLAFGIPLIQKLIKTNGQALILLPTRELALQVNDVLRMLCGSSKISTAVLIGGASMYLQIKDLRKNPRIIVATPGRLDDHLRQKNCTLDKINTIVLDEADRMFDIGFSRQIKEIIAKAPKERQTLLFSATMPEEIAKIALHHMKTPLRIEVATQGTASKNVEQEIFIVEKENKIKLLEHILKENYYSILIFVRTKHGAKRLTQAIIKMGHPASEIHSNKSLSQRKAALAGFKAGKYRALVATDIASRGIDVKNISLVLNYDLPDDVNDYVHRIGRTGRAENKGKAVTFVTQTEKYLIRKIERLIKKEIRISSTPKLPNTENRMEISGAREQRPSRPTENNHRNNHGRVSRNFPKKPTESLGKKFFFKEEDEEGKDKKTFGRKKSGRKSFSRGKFSHGKSNFGRSSRY